MPRKRVLIVHSDLSPIGGSNVVAAWSIQALKDAYEVSLATMTQPDFAAVDRTFGTSLSAAGIDVRIAPPRYVRLRRSIPVQGALLTWALATRLARRLAEDDAYDLSFSTDNEADLGRRGLQYIHYPRMYLPRPEAEMRWFHRVPGALRAYRRGCMWIARASPDGLRANFTLANSQFAAHRFEQTHGVKPAVLYPPVPGEFPAIPWEERREAFVAVGRLHPIKRWELAVEILERVRARGHAAGLTLIGHRDDEVYADRLTRLTAQRPWFRVLTNLSRGELTCEVASHRYGIHPMCEEHFGIAPAEMQKAGCITFVHNSGGPVEIVGGHPKLVFNEAGDAVEKIVAVLTAPRLADDLRAHGARQSELFSAERFCQGLRESVAQLT